MALDRDNTLKKAEKLLRQGRLDGAIAEYVKLVDDQPRDWNTANTLGDLYARAGQTDLAVGQYSRIAEHFMREGFYPKAAALYKKILKVNKNDEATQLQLAEISALQGLLADAKSHLNAVAARRRARGDRRGEAEIIVRLGALDPADLDARLAAARTLEQMGEDDEAAEKYKALHVDLMEKERTAEALDVLRALIKIRPLDVEARSALARSAIDAGDITAAREFLDRDMAGNDPTLLMALVDLDLRAGDVDSARELIPTLLRTDYGLRHKLQEVAASLVEQSPRSAAACIESIVDCVIEHSDFHEAASILQEFIARSPGQIGALLKLVEVCVDGGFEAAMYEAQVLLTDAYLEAGQASEARVIAEDLVAREPWEPAHIERFRRALVMLKVPDPDTEIAERLSGQAPFMATDPFIDLSDPPVPPADGAESGETPLAPEPAAVDGAADQFVAADAASSDERPAGDQVEVPVGATEAREVERTAVLGYQEFDFQAPARAQPIGVRPSKAGADEIDLTGALGSIDEAAAADRRPAEPALDAQGSDHHDGGDRGRDYSLQHMTLARTYLEMGMLDQAEEALKIAAQAPRLRFEAGSLLGRLLRQRGDMAQALEWLERASEAPPTNLDEGRALMYDFGVTLDETGETARALAVFLELQAEAGDYRDVPERIDRLARVQSGG